MPIPISKNIYFASMNRNIPKIAGVMFLRRKRPGRIIFKVPKYFNELYNGYNYYIHWKVYIFVILIKLLGQVPDFRS